MAAWLKITKNGQSTFIKLSSEQPINLPMQEGVQYQVVDIGGNPLEVETLSQSKSTTLITPNGEKITLTHEHYAPIQEKSLPLNRDTVEAVEVVSSSVESSGILSTAAYIGGGLLTLGGVAAAAGGSKKSGSSPSHSEPTVSAVPTPQAELSATAPVNRPQTQQSQQPEQLQPSEQSQPSQQLGLPTTPPVSDENSLPQPNNEEAKQKEPEKQVSLPIPTLQFDQITGDDIINAEEASRSLTVSGTVQNLQANDRLSLKIGDVAYEASIADGRFSAQVSGQTLATHGVITAEVIRGEATIKTAIQHSVEVKTALPTTPSVTLAKIAGDNIINLAESKGEIAVSGTIENAKEGEEVIVSCGCPTCTGVQWIDVKTTVQAGGFSVKFANGELLKEGFSIVKARVTTTDEYGNKATGEGSQSYEVDIEPPKPSLIFDPISPINQATAETIKISGKVVNLQAGETGTVTATVGNQNYTAQIQNSSYEFSVPKAQFAGGNKVALRLNVADRAGNTAELTASENEQNQSYQYDVTLNKPTIVIEPVQTVNKATQTVRFSGTLDYDSDVNPSQTEVSVNLNGTAHKATVQGKNWALELPANQLNGTQGERPFSVTAKVQDQLGNQAETTTAGNFTVDTIAPTLQIELDDIAPIPNQGEKVQLSGTVSGEVKPAFVSLTINAQEKQVAVQENGKFSTEIDRLQLVQSADHKVIVRATSQDEAGNVATAQAEKPYTVVPTVSEPSGEFSIQLDNITGDNHLNVSEVKTATTRISGQVSGKGVQAGQKVSLIIGEQTIQATLNQSLQFSEQVDTAWLRQSKSRQITASLGEKSVSRGYTIADEALASVRITEVSDVVQGEMVRVKGGLILTDLASQYKNPLRFHELSISLNNKTYAVGLDEHQKFNLEIPLADLLTAQGETLIFNSKGDGLLSLKEVYNQQGRRLADDVVKSEFPPLTADNVRFETNGYIVNGKVATNLVVPTSKIMGEVSGIAKENDIVLIRLGNQQVEARVQSNKTFEVTLPNEVVSKANGQISENYIQPQAMSKRLE